MWEAYKLPTCFVGIDLEEEAFQKHVKDCEEYKGRLLLFVNLNQTAPLGHASKTAYHWQFVAYNAGCVPIQ